MSYSYIKTVFPNYSYSNVYDVNLYKNELDDKNEKVVNKSTLFTGIENNSYTSVPSSNNEFEKIDSTQTLLEKFTINDNKDNNKDNLKYYNIPLQANYNNGMFEEQHNPVTFNHHHRESFDNSINGDKNHNDYLKHIYECSQCKNIVLKQFNLDADRIFREEILELISYIIFGILILMLIER